MPIPAFITFSDSKIKSFSSLTTKYIKSDLINIIKEHMITMFIKCYINNITDHKFHFEKRGFDYKELNPNEWFSKSFEVFSEHNHVEKDYFHYKVFINGEWRNPWSQQDLYYKAREKACNYLIDKINNTEPKDNGKYKLINNDFIPKYDFEEGLVSESSDEYWSTDSSEDENEKN